MEKEGALLPLQEKAIKLDNPPSFHLLVSPSHLRNLYKIGQGATDLLPSPPSTLCQGNVQFSVSSACSCLFTHLCEGDALWGDGSHQDLPCGTPLAKPLLAQGQSLRQCLRESGVTNSFAD